MGRPIRLRSCISPPTPISRSQFTHLQSVLPGEALLAKCARERLHREVNPLMPLQVVIPVEALRALVALERAVLLRVLRSVGVHCQGMRPLLTVRRRETQPVDAPHHGQGGPGMVHVRQDRVPRQVIASIVRRVRSLVAVADGWSHTGEVARLTRYRGGARGGAAGRRRGRHVRRVLRVVSER